MVTNYYSWKVTSESTTVNKMAQAIQAPIALKPSTQKPEGLEKISS